MDPGIEQSKFKLQANNKEVSMGADKPFRYQGPAIRVILILHTEGTDSGWNNFVHGNLSVT